MSKWLKHSIRFVIVSVGIVLLTSFTIDATDTLRGSQTALSIFAQKVTEGGCPTGMVESSSGGRSYCIDVYENGVGSACAFVPQQAMDTKNNIAASACVSVSKQDIAPWTFVTFHQAKELCAKRGMRLPTSNEWYDAALGTPVESAACNINGTRAHAGVFSSCVSSLGVHDMIGNVWEWVDEEVIDGTYHERTLPDEGYVTEADTGGVATVTADDPSALFDNDYFWHTKEGVFTLLRGGFYGSGNDAGLYAVHAETAPSFASAAIGFRCVVDL